MATISPNPFPTNGIHTLGRADYLIRQKAIQCALPKDNAPSCAGQVFVGIFFDGTSNNLHYDYEVPPLEKRKHSTVVKIFYSFLHASMLTFMLTLTACGASGKQAEKLEGTSYLGVNNTDKNIVSIIVNGEGGISAVSAQHIGGQDCCVNLPRKWHPGIKVTIKWQEDDVYLLDKNGKFVIEDGKKKVIEQPWKTKTVEVGKYEGRDEEGMLYIFFYPNDVVKALRSRGYPCSREGYSLPASYNETCVEMKQTRENIKKLCTPPIAKQNKTWCADETF